MSAVTRTSAFVLLALLALRADGASGRAAKGPELVPLARADRAHCERSALLRPACPRLVPRVAGYLSYLGADLAPIRAAHDVFNLEHGGEHPNEPARNRPPRMAHVILVAGHVYRAAPFDDPARARRVPLRDGVVRQERSQPVSFGRVRWGGREGTLYLAPPFPTGGMLGNHLAFRWREQWTTYELSLHAWEPLTETARTLRAMVAALPGPRAAAALARRSHMRFLGLGQGRTTARARITAPPPRHHAFNVRISVRPASADVEAWIQTWYGQRFHFLDSTRKRGRCRFRNFRAVCDVALPRLEAQRGGRWTIVVRKRTQAAANVRVDVVFE